MVKRCWNLIKIGTQSPFGLRSPFRVCPRFSNKIWAGLDYLVIRLSWSHYENLGRRQNREGCVKSIPEGGGAEFGQEGGGSCLCPHVLRARLNNLRNIRKFLVTPCSVRENMSVVPCETNLSGEKNKQINTHSCDNVLSKQNRRRCTSRRPSGSTTSCYFAFFRTPSIGQYCHF